MRVHLVYWILLRHTLAFSRRSSPQHRHSRRIASSLLLSSPLSDLLHDHGYGARLITLDDTSLPRTAEVYVNGRTRLAHIIETVHPNKHNKDETKQNGAGVDPKVRVQWIDNDDNDENVPNTPAATVTVVDIGQLTTVWETVYYPMEETNEIATTTTVMDDSNKNKNNNIDAWLEDLYQSRSRSHRPTTSTSTLTKATMARWCATMDDPTAAQALLRHAAKTGPQSHRLVDSAVAAITMNEAVSSPITTTTTNTTTASSLQSRHRAVSAMRLSDDARTGGRFKRVPCRVLPSIPTTTTTTTTLFNGGWLVVDPAVRASADARKFVERHGKTVAMAIAADEPKRMNATSHGTQHQALLTPADARIVQRLECLAMGQVEEDVADSSTHNQRSRKNDSNTPPPSFAVDVRDTLTALQLDVSPDGARTALIHLGQWSTDGAAAVTRITQPWSPAVLEAAQVYARYVGKDRTTDHDGAAAAPEGVADLRHLPCVSVDAKSTTFRDDAIGVRPRAGTGRKLLPDASKWELLIHIADVTDIYCPNMEPSEANSNDDDGDSLQQALETLRHAAERRGASRYDLPRGPLHLLPPVALRALAFRPNTTPSTTTSLSPATRCVTLWVYMDDRTGRVLEAGLERTLVSSPMALSYPDANAIMKTTTTSSSSSSFSSSAAASSEPLTASNRKARALLLVAERSLLRWNERRLSHSAAARKRQSRLQTKAATATDVSSSSRNDAFERTRAHALVDAALDLYSHVSSVLMRQAKAPVPISVGANVSRGGRLATAPLRRYIDGQTQRQLVAVHCGYGVPMSLQECKECATAANQVRNAISNVRSVKN